MIVDIATNSRSDAPWGVSEVFLADLLSHRHYNPLPQAIMVPRPRARATAIFTHTGMNLVSLSMWGRQRGHPPSVRWVFQRFFCLRSLHRADSDVRYRSLRRIRRWSALRSASEFLPVRISEISRHLVPIAAKVRSVTLPFVLHVIVRARRRRSDIRPLATPGEWRSIWKEMVWVVAVSSATEAGVVSRLTAKLSRHDTHQDQQ